MKVLENSPERLVLRERPVVMGAIIGGFVLVLGAAAVSEGVKGNHDQAGGAALAAGLMLLAFIVFVRDITLIFDRTVGTLEISNRGLLGRRVRTLPLAQIRTVKVELDPDRERTKSGHPLSRPVLVTMENKVIPLRGSYSGDADAETIASTMRTWLGLGQVKKAKRR